MWNACREMSHCLYYLPCYLRAKLSQSNIYCSNAHLNSGVCCHSVTSPWSLRAEEGTLKTCLVGQEIVTFSDTKCLVGYQLITKEKYKPERTISQIKIWNELMGQLSRKDGEVRRVIISFQEKKKRKEKANNSKTPGKSNKDAQHDKATTFLFKDENQFLILEQVLFSSWKKEGSG